jgi:hypothetical protein
MVGMKLLSLGFPLAALLLGAGCGRTELDLQAEDTEGQVGASSMAGSGGWTTAWMAGGTTSVGGQAGNPGGPGGSLAPVAGSTFIQPPASAGAGIIASTPPNQGGIRGGTTALPPPGGSRPPAAGNVGGTITTIPRTTGGVRGGTITSIGGRVAGFTATSGRGGTMGGAVTVISGRAGAPGGAISTAVRGGASGGTSVVGGSGGGSGSCPGPLAGEDLIDDMNDGNRYIPTNSGRAGAWNVSHDASPDGTMFPATSSAFTMTDTGDTCRKKAVYTSGSLFVEWGSNVWVSLGAPYDASKYRGITFWARIDGGTSPTLRVSFPDKDTQPDGALCQASAPSGPTACFDHYGKQLSLTTEWTKYTVLFSEITQQRWGRQGTAFDPTTLFEILFQIPATAKFGMWIDDVSFVFPTSNGLY